MLKDSIARNPDMASETKSRMEQSILQLDSASNAILRWKGQFIIPNDKEALDKFSTEQLVKIKEVRRYVLKVIESNKGIVNDKNRTTEPLY